VNTFMPDNQRSTGHRQFGFPKPVPFGPSPVRQTSGGGSDLLLVGIAILLVAILGTLLWIGWLLLKRSQQENPFARRHNI